MIDTGIDLNNKVLQDQLANGYDFTTNTNGGSEMGDVAQSTAGIIDRSTQPAQVNQSTAGVIDQGIAPRSSISRNIPPSGTEL